MRNRPRHAIPATLSKALQPTLKDGDTIHGFKVVDQLGSGVFGRVYLVRQSSLADRLVVLKVGCDLYQESQVMAQLQHSHIVPIISVHQKDRIQCVCMPYFGPTTLGYALDLIGKSPSLPTSGSVWQTLLRKNSNAPDNLKGDDYWHLYESQRYERSVLTLMLGVVDGLAHAHARGILHCDLKPENILLADDGRAMLLDFNLARDTKLEGERLSFGIGGTLPYMAPEHLELLLAKKGQLNQQCDVYSLGVILFELLTGRHPFNLPTGKLTEIIPGMIAERKNELPSLLQLNSKVTPAMQSIVYRCLAPDLSQRYQSARELTVDLERQLADHSLQYAEEPSRKERLQKWIRRHPRLSSSSSVAVIAAVVVVFLLALLYLGRESLRGFQAKELLHAHQQTIDELRVQLDDRFVPLKQFSDSVQLAQNHLAKFDLSLGHPTPEWRNNVSLGYMTPLEKTRLQEDLGEMFYLLAKAGMYQLDQADTEKRVHLLEQAFQWNQMAEMIASDRIPRAVKEQKADLLKLNRQIEAESRARNEAKSTPVTTARDHYLVGYGNINKGKYVDAVSSLRASTRLDPHSFSTWFSLGNVHLELGQPEFALACFNTCISLRPDSYKAWYNRGLAYSKMKFWDLAGQDYDEALRMNPDMVEAYIQRAAVNMSFSRFKQAEKDLTSALNCGTHPTRVYFMRSSVRSRLNDKPGAEQDRQEGLKLTPTDELSWVARSEVRERTDAKAALDDIEEALKLNPLSLYALQQKAHLLEERLGRKDEALQILNRAVELYPDHVPTLAGRGVNLARRGKRDEALKDAENALRRDSKAPNLYQVACIYALTSKIESNDRIKCFSLLWGALRTGFGLDIVDTDPDLSVVRKEAEFQRIVADAKRLQRR
ncbi:MAG: serine/threonine-protein kinase [Gemmatales bacterium]